jgi:hypothetical protein
MAPDSARESILEFLSSAKSSPTRNNRCACGSTMARQNTTFFYNGQSWEVILSVCLKCHPAPDVPVSYDA